VDIDEQVAGEAADAVEGEEVTKITAPAKTSPTLTASQPTSTTHVPPTLSTASWPLSTALQPSSMAPFISDSTPDIHQGSTMAFTCSLVNQIPQPPTCLSPKRQHAQHSILFAPCRQAIAKIDNQLHTLFLDCPKSHMRVNPPHSPNSDDDMQLPAMRGRGEVRDRYSCYHQSSSNGTTSYCSSGSRDSSWGLQIPNDHTLNAEQRSPKELSLSIVVDNLSDTTPVRLPSTPSLQQWLPDIYSAYLPSYASQPSKDEQLSPVELCSQIPVNNSSGTSPSRATPVVLSKDCMVSASLMPNMHTSSPPLSTISSSSPLSAHISSSPPLSVHTSSSPPILHPMVCLIEEYSSVPIGSRLGPTETSIVWVLSLGELTPDLIIDRGQGRPCHYHLTKATLNNVCVVVTAQQTFIQQAAALIMEWKSRFIVDPRDTLIHILQGTSSLPQLYVAWKVLISRMRLGVTTWEKYIAEYQLQVGATALSPLPTLHCWVSNFFYSSSIPLLHFNSGFFLLIFTHTTHFHQLQASSIFFLLAFTPTTHSHQF